MDSNDQSTVHPIPQDVPDGEIQDTVSTSQPVKTSESKKPKSSNFLKDQSAFLYGIGLVLIAIGLGAYFLKNNNQIPLFTKTAEIKVESTPTAIPTKIQSPVFKTYINTKYSYSLKVPSNMKVDGENKTQDTKTEVTSLQSMEYELDDSICRGGCTYPIKKGWMFQVSIQKNWNQGFHTKLFKTIPPLKLPGVLFEEEKKINGFNMLITERTRVDNPSVGNTDWYADFVNNGMWYRFIYSTDKTLQSKSKEIFYQMLSSFKSTYQK